MDSTMEDRRTDVVDVGSADLVVVELASLVRILGCGEFLEQDR